MYHIKEPGSGGRE